jgi:hypothetical protein
VTAADHAATVREWLMDEWTAEERMERTAENNPALAALDRLEAQLAEEVREKWAWNQKAGEMADQRNAARAERDEARLTAVRCSNCAAAEAERDEARQAALGHLTAAQAWKDSCKEAERERDEARRLLREVVKADRQDAQMGYPIPGDSCMGAFIGLVLMEYLDSLAKEGTDD